MLKLGNLIQERRVLSVFDFDDTIAKSDAWVYVTRAGRITKKLDPAQFAVYKPKPGEDFDFSMLDEDFKNDSIKQELILQKVLLAEARSLGFINESTRNETKKEIVQSPIFQIEGIFDEGVYEAQVNSNGFTKEGYIDVMTDFTASDLYRGSLNTISFVTQKELQTLAELFEK